MKVICCYIFHFSFLFCYPASASPFLPLPSRTTLDVGMMKSTIFHILMRSAFILLGLRTLGIAGTSVECEEDMSKCTLTEEKTDSSLASASVVPGSETASNFGTLTIQTEASGSDLAQAFAAGYLEGALTADMISDQVSNLFCQVDCTGEVPAPVAQYLSDQRSYMDDMVAANPDDPLWVHVGLTNRQFDGVLSGYSEHASAPFKDVLWAIQLANYVGDMFDIIPAVEPMKRPNLSDMTVEELRLFQATSGHCSAIIRVADDLSDIFFGHSSWYVYSAMIRLYKSYDFSSMSATFPNKRTSFSSYPGMISSLDDFYLNHDTGLSMVQTTNNVFNTSLYDLVKPQSLPAWHRVRAANAVANSGEDWYNIVSRENSGTYNNQYMIVDKKKFLPFNAIQPGTLYVVEQIPGMVVGGDQSEILSFSYWSSYNVPFYTSIYDASGYPDVDEKNNQTHGTEYQMAPRAKIFRRDHGNVNSIDSLQRILRYNGFGNGDEFAVDGWSAICSRGDLNSPPTLAGCYDSKATSASTFPAAYVINGPTSQDQPPFSWSKFEGDDKNMHEGQLDTFETLWELIPPQI